MNSVLQCLTHTPPLAELCLQPARLSLGAEEQYALDPIAATQAHIKRAQLEGHQPQVRRRVCCVGVRARRWLAGGNSSTAMARPRARSSAGRGCVLGGHWPARMAAALPHSYRRWRGGGRAAGVCGPKRRLGTRSVC
jgi:hypothetical protein